MRFKLGTKFTLLLSLVFACGIGASWLLLSQVLERRSEAEVNARGLLLIETMNSVRHYTSSQINSLLQDDLMLSETFVSETVPAYSAREVFETLRQNPAYAAYLYKEATLNPTNERDLVDPFERTLVEQFREQPGLTHLNGFTEREGVQLYYSARPLTVSSQSCLTCHSTPDVAPASLISTFGSDGGFGWNVGEIIAAQIIYVPAGDIFGSAQLWLALVMISLVVIFAAIVLVTNYLLKRMVVRPVEHIATMAQQISAGNWSPKAAEVGTMEAIAERQDELGYTAQVFENMAKEVYEREQKLKREVRQLHIQIDVHKRETEVKQITESEYFVDLQKKAKQLRAANAAAGG